MLAIGIEASARTETLRWQQPSNSPTFAGFKVYWSPNGATPRISNVSLPTPDSQGVYSAAVMVDDGAYVSFSITAYNSVGGESTASNSICRDPSGVTVAFPCVASGTGGGTSGGGTGGAAQSAIIGFKLWDANADSVIEQDFQDNDVISNGCVAIEILGNAYLTTGSGSVLKQLGSGATSCENYSQFGWEDDAGVNQFDCAASLQTNGSYTLKVTPYDGKNCGGTAGAMQTRTFSVNLSQAPPPPPPAEMLGTPGKPYLVPE